MKFLFVFSLLGGCCLAGAQTNLLAIAQPGPELVITSRTFIFDGKASQIVYVGHVFATDNINKSLHCGAAHCGFAQERRRSDEHRR